MEQYSSKEEILKHIRKRGRKYIQITHHFSSGEIVEEHFHPNVDEWIIFNNGTFEVAIDFDKKTVHAHGYSFIHFPKGHIHSLTCLTDISYTVLRSGKDRIVYLDKLLEKKVKPIRDHCGTLWEFYNKGNLSIAYVDVTGTAEKHKHLIMEEKYRIEKGEGQLTIGRKTITVSKGDVIPIPKDKWHYLTKIGKQLEVLVITHPKYNPKDVIFDK